MECADHIYFFTWCDVDSNYCSYSATTEKIQLHILGTAEEAK